MFKSLWSYRRFVLISIQNELITRFARSKLGGIWMIINPLAQVAIYALILSNVLAAKLQGIDNKYGYALYIMTGLLAWSLFTEIVTRCLNLFVEQGNLMKKINFPRISLPVIVVGSSVLNNALLFLAMLAIFFVLGHSFSFMMLWLLPLSLVVIAFALGIGLILGTMNVFVRDIGQATGIILNIWFWLTPIVYPQTIIPESYRALLYFNPFFPIVDAYQRTLVYNASPNFIGLGINSAIAVSLMIISLFLFRRASAEMVDNL